MRKLNKLGRRFDLYATTLFGDKLLFICFTRLTEEWEGKINKKEDLREKDTPYLRTA